VMLNLILNAIAVMSGSSETRELLIRTEQDGPGACSSPYSILAWA
jgi:hypothetical protein